MVIHLHVFATDHFLPASPQPNMQIKRPAGHTPFRAHNDIQQHQDAHSPPKSMAVLVQMATRTQEDPSLCYEHRSHALPQPPCSPSSARGCVCPCPPPGSPSSTSCTPEGRIEFKQREHLGLFKQYHPHPWSKWQSWH